jgi:lipoprotein-anchoring transpeptidase ErfK/SrfK
MPKNFIENRTLIFFISLTVLPFLLAGCAAPAGETNSNTNAALSDSQNSNASNENADIEKTAVDTERAVTLPVLNAMFADERFSGDLKAALQLSDEEIERLKTAAQNAVDSLDEDADGEYAGSTRAALNHSVETVSGIIGREKTARLFEFVRKRWAGADELLAQLNENMSAEPNQVPSDTRIVVNSPAYRMDVFRDGKLIKTYKVGIGYPEFPLPQGLRRAEKIIFNPTWTPPDEPWVKGKVRPGKTVEAGSKLNPLGPVKIPIGLPSLIHGGKDPSRLGTFASHGCVGLTSPLIQDFSLVLAGISGTALSPEDVKNYEKQNTKTIEVKLADPVLVELRYETIVVEDGRLKIFRDVYEKGTNTEENLRRVLDHYNVSLDGLAPEQKQKILEGLEQMAFDAQGEKVEPVESDTNANKTDNKNSASSHVTRNVKGKKEVVFELAELKGKGYPAPVDGEK